MLGAPPAVAATVASAYGIGRAVDVALHVAPSAAPPSQEQAPHQYLVHTVSVKQVSTSNVAYTQNERSRRLRSPSHPLLGVPRVAPRAQLLLPFCGLALHTVLVPRARLPDYSLRLEEGVELALPQRLLELARRRRTRRPRLALGAASGRRRTRRRARRRPRPYRCARAGRAGARARHGGPRRWCA
jgi:hypothetical protein